MIKSNWFSISTATETTLISFTGAVGSLNANAPISNLQLIRVLGLSLSFSGSVNAKFTTGPAGGATTQVSQTWYGSATYTVILPQGPVPLGGMQGWFEGQNGLDLNIKLSAGTAVDGIILWAAVQ